MIKHIVMWRLKEFAEGNNKSANAKKIKTSLEELRGKIKQIKFIEVGIDINKSAQAFDVVLNSEFENMEDLNIYQNHPEHIKIAEFISKVKNERIVVDYNV